MNFLYNLAIRGYIFGIRQACNFDNLKAMQMEMGRDHLEETLSEKMESLKKECPNPRIIWFHAASLGEFEQGRPLIEQLREQYPEYHILVTFFSPSGYEIRKNYKGADIISYLPYDKPKLVKNFLDIVKPEKALFIKYEFWGNMLQELHRRNIPIYLVSGIFRKHQIFFKWYGKTMRPVLHLFNHIFVQDEESKDLLAKLNVNNVTICGDTRFDRVISIQKQAKQYKWAEDFRSSSKFILIAGSSWPKDEEIFIEHFNNHPEMKLIIAPHEIHEEHVQGIVSKLKRPYMRYSQLDETKVKDVDCIIIDAIGFLSSIYRYGDVAYIGGGFGVGIHNTLEAAVYGIPVIFGPNHQAFREALGLLETGGGFTIDDAHSYNTLMDSFLSDQQRLKSAGKNADEYVANNSGASETIFQAVFKPKSSN
ncbi:MAG: 3-deoxy-D-manno-octulosonic acid transferase [Bacteroidales bacterium]|nr:3-deoxy-D-manno-octulosonic acid transferase [Bacteroidales bacterium]